MEKFQKKSITPVDCYKFTLSDELKQIAEDELRETDVIRENALQQLREWAIQNPRLATLRLDAKFLLRFLRAKKFSIPMTRESLERYLVLRKYFFEGQYIYQNFDYRLPQLLKLFDKGFIFALPERDHLGRRVVFHRPAAFAAGKDINHDIIRSYGIVFETLLEDEENQIRGVVHVLDTNGLGLQFLTVYSPQEAYRISKNAEKMVPMRHKEMNGTYPHPALKYLIDWVVSILSQKLQKRVHLYMKVEDVKSIDGKKLFPKEYGGVIPMKDMIDMFKKELDVSRDMLLNHDNMHVKMEMYPESVRIGSVRSLSIPLDSPDEAFEQKNDLCSMGGVQGSFRKLEID